MRTIDDEAEAFSSMKRDLLNRYRGTFVAVLDGKVVGSDIDAAKLSERVHAKYGNERWVYIDLVSPVEKVII